MEKNIWNNAEDDNDKEKRARERAHTNFKRKKKDIVRTMRMCLRVVASPHIDAFKSTAQLYSLHKHINRNEWKIKPTKIVL